MYEICAAWGGAEILLYEDIGDSWGGTTAKRFIDDLKAVGGASWIDLRINSSGGSVTDGIAIYNALRRHPAKITVHIDGIAASIASVVAMAGDEILMAANGFLMIHNPWVQATGESSDLRRVADTMDEYADIIAGIYIDRTGLDADTIADMMDRETWLNPSRALELGFIDGIDGEARIAAHLDIDRFSHPPSQLLTKTLRVRANRRRSRRAQLDRMKLKAEMARQHLVLREHGLK